MKNLYFTITNNGYTDIVINFINRCVDLKIFFNDFLIVCTDEQSAATLNKYESLGIKILPIYQILDNTISTEFVAWATANYKHLVFFKLKIKEYILKKFYQNYNNIIYLDTDMWINWNFIDEMNNILRNSEYDVIFQDGEDYLQNTDDCCIIQDGCRLVHKTLCNSYCTGFMVMNTKQTQKIITDLLSYDQSNFMSYAGNQEFINERLYYSDLRAMCFPKRLIPNLSNHNFFRSYQHYWMLHYTYIRGKDKISYMKKYNHWTLP